MPDRSCDLGLIGLAVMGENHIARFYPGHVGQGRGHSYVVVPSQRRLPRRGPFALKGCLGAFVEGRRVKCLLQRIAHADGGRGAVNLVGGDEEQVVPYQPRFTLRKSVRKVVTHQERPDDPALVVSDRGDANLHELVLIEPDSVAGGPTPQDLPDHGDGVEERHRPESHGRCRAQ